MPNRLSLTPEEIRDRRARIEAAFPSRKIPKGWTLSQAAEEAGFGRGSNLRAFVRKHAWDLLPELSERPPYQVGSPITTEKP